MAEEVLILGAARTPVGRLNGALASVSAPELAAAAIRGACAHAGIEPRSIEEVWLGCLLSAGLGPDPARLAASAAGAAPRFAACLRAGRSSGLAAIVAACGRVGGAARVVVAGGMDSSSRSPFLLPDARRGSRLGHARMLDAIGSDAPAEATDPEWLERVRRLGAVRRPAESLLVPIEVPARKGKATVVTDEASGAGGDGAAAVVLAAGPRVRPLGRIVGAGYGADLASFDGERFEAVEIAGDSLPGASGAIGFVDLIATLREIGGGKGICVAGTGGSEAAAVSIEVFPR